MTDLTEQWKKGELPEGDYYYKLDGIIDIGTKGGLDVFEFYADETRKKDMEVLAKVPSYEEYTKLKERYDRAIWWLKEIVTCHRHTPISTAEKALKELLSKTQNQEYVQQMNLQDTDDEVEE